MQKHSLQQPTYVLSLKLLYQRGSTLRMYPVGGPVSHDAIGTDLTPPPSYVDR